MRYKNMKIFLLNEGKPKLWSDDEACFGFVKRGALPEGRMLVQFTGESHEGSYSFRVNEELFDQILTWFPTIDAQYMSESSFSFYVSLQTAFDLRSLSLLRYSFEKPFDDLLDHYLLHYGSKFDPFTFSMMHKYVDRCVAEGRKENFDRKVWHGHSLIPRVNSKLYIPKNHTDLLNTMEDYDGGVHSWFNPEKDAITFPSVNDRSYMVKLEEPYRTIFQEGDLPNGVLLNINNYIKYYNEQTT